MNYKILWIFLFMSSCVTKSQKLVGEYENNPKMSIWDKANMYLFGNIKPVSIIKLNLYADSSFMYKDCGDPNFGKWTVDGKDLTLNYEYYLKDKNLSDTVYIGDSINVKIKISGNKIIEKSNIKIKDKYYNLKVIFIKKQ